MTRSTPPARLPRSIPDADVLVIGAGPAGATAAARLAREGIEVLVVERDEEPGFKLGESLLPSGIGLCLELGMGDRLEAAAAEGLFQEKHGARFVLSADGKDDRFAFREQLRPERGSLAYEVKRRDFDALLAAHAESLGARIERGFPVVEVELEAPEGVAVQGPRGRRSARFLLDASGPQSLLARRLGRRGARIQPPRAALFTHCEGVPRLEGELAGDIVILWSPGGWFWVIPFKDGTASVGVVAEPATLRAAGADDGARFDVLCAQSETHRAWLGARRPLFPVRRAADYAYQVTPLFGERFLLLGDAAGFVDPIFSTGVFLAQHGAFLAADALLPALREGRLPRAEELAAYEAELTFGVRNVEGFVGHFYDTSFMDQVVRSRRRPELRRAITSLLAGDVFHRENPLVRMGLLEPRQG